MLGILPPGLGARHVRHEPRVHGRAVQRHGRASSCSVAAIVIDARRLRLDEEDHQRSRSDGWHDIDDLLIGLVLFAGAIGLVICTVLSQARREGRSCATRCASSTATRSRTSATRSCSAPLSERALVPVLGGLTEPRSAVHPGRLRRQGAQEVRLRRRRRQPTRSTGSSPSACVTGRGHPAGLWFIFFCNLLGSTGIARSSAAACWSSLALLLGPDAMPQPQGRGAPARDPHHAARRPRPAHDQRRGRPRLRAGPRPHHRRGARAAVRRVRPHARRGPGRCQPRRRHARHGERMQRARAAVVRARHPPGRHLRRVDRPGAAGPGRGDAHQAPPAGPGEGAEGAR